MAAETYTGPRPQDHPDARAIDFLPNRLSQSSLEWLRRAAMDDKDREQSPELCQFLYLVFTLENLRRVHLRERPRHIPLDDWLDKATDQTRSAEKPRIWVQQWNPVQLAKAQSLALWLREHADTPYDLRPLFAQVTWAIAQEIEKRLTTGKD